MRLQAHRQGMLDGLCGIYAAVNALRVLYDNSSDEFHRELFSVAARAIPRKDYPEVLWEGMAMDRLMLIVRSLCCHLLKEYGHHLRAEIPFLPGAFPKGGVRDYLAAVAAERAKTRHSAVIIGIEWPQGHGGGGHWTVLRRSTEAEVELLDSARTPPLKIRSLRLGGKLSYRIAPHETVLIKADTFEQKF